MSRIDEIRDYVSRATPGPWQHKDGDVFRDDDDGFRELIEYGTFYKPSDGEFCARARSDLPLLLEVAEKAHALVAATRTTSSGSSVEQLRAAFARLEETR